MGSLILIILAIVFITAVVFRVMYAIAGTRPGHVPSRPRRGRDFDLSGPGLGFMAADTQNGLLRHGTSPAPDGAAHHHGHQHGPNCDHHHGHGHQHGPDCNHGHHSHGVDAGSSYGGFDSGGGGGGFDSGGGGFDSGGGSDGGGGGSN